MSDKLYWPKWVFASIAQHFTTKCATLGSSPLPLFIEGQHRNTQNLKDFAELRIDGPNLIEVSKNYWRFYSEINILLQSVVNDTNNYRIHTNTGIIIEAFTDISVYKYGKDIGDDDSYVGCLKLIQDARGREKIQISNFGEIAVSVPLVQLTVEGHYRMYLTEGD